MKFTYLLLVGTVASQCTSQEKVDALAASATAAEAYAAALALKTPDVETYETGLTPLKDHVNEMTTALKLAKVGKTPDQAAITDAETNLTAAQNALDAYLAETGHAAFNKILVDIATA